MNVIDVTFDSVDDPPRTRWERTCHFLFVDPAHAGSKALEGVAQTGQGRLLIAPNGIE